MAAQIIGQMLSIAAGDTLITRLLAVCADKFAHDERIVDGKADLLCAQRLARLTVRELRQVGISQRKAECLRTLSLAVVNGKLDFGELRTLRDDEIVARLTAFRGIGGWTAKMYLYKIHRPNVLPFEDVIVQNAYKWLYRTPNATPAVIKKRAQKWSPYCSVAVMFLFAAARRNLLATPAPLLKDLP